MPLHSCGVEQQQHITLQHQRQHKISTTAALSTCAAAALSCSVPSHHVYLPAPVPVQEPLESC